MRSRSIKRCQWKHKMDYYGIVFAHLATGCGINAKDPSGLDSDWWIPHSRCCENPARAKALAGFSRHLSAGFTDLNPAPRGLSRSKCAHFCSEWCIVGYGTGALWDMCDWSIVNQLYYIMALAIQHIINVQELVFMHNNAWKLDGYIILDSLNACNRRIKDLCSTEGWNHLGSQIWPGWPRVGVIYLQPFLQIGFNFNPTMDK